MADLTIITLSRNIGHWRRLNEALSKASKPCSIAALLVNNANSVGLTSEALGAGWMVIEPGYNTSFSLGNNLGAKAAESEWLLLLNDDVTFGEDFLDAMWLPEREADIYGALLLQDDGGVNHAGTAVCYDGRTDHIGRHHRPAEWQGGCPLVPSVTFAAAMIRRELWDRLDGLDEAYHYGWEDTDFCLRALEAGATIRCNRDAVAHHNECGTRPRNGSDDQSNARIFMRRWQPKLSALLTSYGSRAHPEPVEGTEVI